MKETDLYPPIKQLLEAQGYEVKSEIGSADVVACRGKEEPIVVELKTSFSLTLFHQAIERQSLTDAVYVAVPYTSGRSNYAALKRNKKLCRRLGLGLILVRVSDGFAEIHCDPAPYIPRKQKTKKTRLLKEFRHRVGDPNEAGQTRKKVMTAYRQDALRCLKYLSDNGATKASVVAQQISVARARPIMSDDHYGWFERTARGIYGVSPKGDTALQEYSNDIAQLNNAR